MFTYAPENLESSPPLVVVLHGCTQSAASYSHGAGWSTLAERYGFVLLLPEQTTANNPKTCFNWFLPDDTTRGRGEALSIRQMIEKTICDHGIDRRRVFITGLSAGGAMTSVMLAVYPEIFAAGAIIAGLPYGTASNVQEAFESMFHGRPRSAQEWGDLVRRASPHSGPWPRVSVWHGARDATVQPANAEAILQQWINVHGLQSSPIEHLVDGHRRQVWRNGSVDVIEYYTIAGMAHGTPLATGSSAEQCGEAGPFFLEAGISSSYRTAQFFGLTGAGRPRTHTEPAQDRREVNRASLVPEGQTEVIPDERSEILGPDAGVAGRRAQERTGGDPIDVHSIITSALTSAGLMKPPR
ncbi:MAG TPA: PHB depolymerase family esterase [Xanthobacteraceae bacterium]|nr:PHB depolymerase family esterase [Xanthobacteraceae bacterium]